MPDEHTPADDLERCRGLAFEAARLARRGQAGAPERFSLDAPGGGWMISSREPWLQRLEAVGDGTSVAGTVRAHLPQPGRKGPAAWDDVVAAEFEDCLRRFVAERDLPMMLRYDVELVVAVSAVAASAADLRRRIHRVTELITPVLAAVDGSISVEVFPADTFTRDVAGT